MALWAFAYEVMDHPLVSDEEFDALAGMIRPEIDTGHTVFDQFFKTEFVSHSGMWVRKHPDQRGLRVLFERVQSGNWD